MKHGKRFIRGRLVLFVCLLCSLVAVAAVLVEQTPGVPNIFNQFESPFQQQTHFLVFTGSDVAGESATTARAYYNAIDPPTLANPYGSKRNFTQWLVNAGFIGAESQWHSTGPQVVACDLPGCDLPSHQPDGSLTYGDNIINTDSHAIVLNAADLGFVRNQFIRCKPSCSASNPIIYTYLENYPVNPFAAKADGGSGFPVYTGYPRPNEAQAAIASALTRPLGALSTCTVGDTVLGCSIARIADVAFEWAPPPSSPTSSSRYGQLYAFLFNNDPVNGITETIGVPSGSLPDGKVTPNLATGTLNVATVGANPPNAGDPFPPNLDFLGFKQHPGVCFICHGGNPKNLTSTGAYPNQGNVNGFRFLPLDIRNLLFTSDSGGDQPAQPISQAYTDRLNQEIHIKAYNLAVLKTVPTRAQTDEQGTTRVAHLREVIQGWYTNPDGTSRTIQDVDFVPVGWREANGAPAGSEKLYETVLSPSCRSCHFNRELTLDFGTAANFKSYQSDVLQYVLQPLCRQNNPQAGFRPMPLAHLTYQRYWQANQSTQTLPFPNDSEHPALLLSSTGDQIANYFGFNGTAGYCASSH